MLTSRLAPALAVAFLLVSLGVSADELSSPAPPAMSTAGAPDETAMPKLSPSVALVADLAQDVLQELSATHDTAVHVSIVTGDTRLERALQETLVTALFEKKIDILDTPQKGVPTLRLVAFASPSSEQEHESTLSKGFSVAKNVLTTAEPRLGLVTRPFIRDGKKLGDVTLLVTVSLVRENHIRTRKTNAYTIPGHEPFAQLGLSNL